jgi:hypothetical protein
MSIRRGSVISLYISVGGACAAGFSTLFMALGVIASWIG